MRDILFTLIFLSGLTVFADEPRGYWLNEDADMIVRIYDLQNKLQGDIVWLLDSLNEDGELRLDQKNKNKEMRDRTLIGTRILSGFEKQSDHWKSGVIYNHENGNSYSGKIRMDGERLRLTGYLSYLLLFSKTKVWTRVSDLKKYGL